MSLKANPALRDFWRARVPYRRLRGGRFSGKTHDAATQAIAIASACKKKFLCIRQFQNRISHSVYSVLVEKIDNAGMRKDFDITNVSIKHRHTGSEFIFYGIARNISDIKGTEGVDICWIEEAEGLTQEQWGYIDPTIRKEGSEIWFLWNPRLEDDFIETKLVELLGDRFIEQHINYDENPFLSDTARAKAEALKKADPEEYEHVYLGVPRSTDSAAIIKKYWITAAIDAHSKLEIKPKGDCSAGYDVADGGDDLNAVAIVNSLELVHIEEWKANPEELVQSSNRALAVAKSHGAKLLGYDCIGVGAGVGSILSGKVSLSRFNAGAKVKRPDRVYNGTGIKNGEFFSNLKAQAWWELADRFMHTYNAVVNGHQYDPDRIISISSSIDKKTLDKLTVELSTPRKDYDERSFVKVESKKALAARGVVSPNLADAVIIAYANHILRARGIEDAL